MPGGAAHQVGEIAALPKRHSIDHIAEPALICTRPPCRTPSAQTSIRCGRCPMPGGRQRHALLRRQPREASGPTPVWHSGKLRGAADRRAVLARVQPAGVVLGDARPAARRSPGMDPRRARRGSGRFSSSATCRIWVGCCRLLLRGDPIAPRFPLHGCVALEQDGERWKETLETVVTRQNVRTVQNASDRS